MAKSAAALHILVKEEKLALEISPNWSGASASIIWRNAILNVRLAATAAT
ncbi:peptidyl-prolyl cis-trans isomerase C [Klebsiella pneumoniae]|nr:peptidyl-prolyl cis-trans isomerase C [Klebsiella pneumoniae]